jgi:DNA-binding XRE family transcriptional regulator
MKLSILQRQYANKNSTNILMPGLNRNCTYISTMSKPSTSKIEQYIIDKVRDKRIKLKISQAELARLLDLSEGFIGNVESSKYRAKYNLNHLNAIAKVLGCSPRELLPKEPI